MNQHVSRRNVFASSAAVAAAALAPFDEAKAAQAEAPMTKVNRLARELAVAMDEWIEDMGTADTYVAHIYPSKSSKVGGFQSFRDLGEEDRPPSEGIYKPLPHHADALSFMRRRKPRGSGVDHWIVEASGNYRVDCNLGHQLADEYLNFIGDHPTNGNATLLGCIVNDMVRVRTEELKPWGRHLTGVEIGFLGEINKFAMAVAQVRAEVMGRRGA
ncbi:hypothetical protein EN932_28370 [Mesorhizobium sp. M7A.F.Ca.US.002.01.1.1]|uniref:hypothetical protein n=1 Tax=Mesorhizobium sp. M7A.F.Ca.US.002.01.1.1 TaxID=2496700 RepID=UPI000FD552C2|nr:hypothetical protein [Mesorhizobium sp. M7A.F.Ca.US.002.01.1.1]RVA06594.1 hypothetical protein EN932_28370 [Mesorhizobium sp. M7A.F.Ca.US.002.01.1.1]